MKLPEYAKSRVVVILPTTGEATFNPERMRSLRLRCGAFATSSSCAAAISIATSITAPALEMKIHDMNISEKLSLTYPIYINDSA